MTTWLEAAAERRPDALALVQGADRLDYAGLAGQASRRAAMLAGMGLRGGDRVMLESPVTLESAVWLHALVWLGAAVVPIAPSLSSIAAENLLRRLKPRALITYEPTAYSETDGLPGENEHLIVVDAAQPADLDLAPLAPAAHDPARIATIILTSGSSATPKAVPLTLANHAASAAAIAERIGSAMGSAIGSAIGSTIGDRWLLCLPLEHIGGLAVLLRSVMQGHAVALMRRFDPAGVIEQIDAHGITLASLVPSMLDGILKLGKSPPSDNLRAVFVGGAPAAPALMERARDAGWPVLPTWGMTEACSQLATPAPATAAGINFFGKPSVALPPLPGVQVRTAPSGALQVRGPMLFSGYLDDGESGPDAEGWFSTGDRGIVDSDGAVRVLGRIDNVIISGGINVHLDAVAQRLAECPLIQDAALVGIDDPRWGQRVAAAVVAADSEIGLTEALETWSREHLSPAERPARWRVTDCIPRSSAGKPLAPAVRALFEAPIHARRISARNENGNPPESV